MQVVRRRGAGGASTHQSSVIRLAEPACSQGGWRGGCWLGLAWLGLQGGFAASEAHALDSIAGAARSERGRIATLSGGPRPCWRCRVGAPCRAAQRTCSSGCCCPTPATPMGMPPAEERAGSGGGGGGRAPSGAGRQLGGSLMHPAQAAPKRGSGRHLSAGAAANLATPGARATKTWPRLFAACVSLHDYRALQDHTRPALSAIALLC